VTSSTRSQPAPNSGPTVAARRPWSTAAAETLDRLAKSVRDEADSLLEDADPDAVHDTRTSTRRVRTALEIYGDLAPAKRRRRDERELRRVAHRLGAVRDLDVLIETLDDGLAPLRDAWPNERRKALKDLRAEICRDRFDRCLDDLADIAHLAAHGQGAETPEQGSNPRVAYRAPGIVWASFGTLLSFEIEPNRADPAAIHRMRIAAKKLRYTLEAFENAISGSGAMIERVTRLQDEAGAMHDALVAADRARSFLESARPKLDESRAIRNYAAAQRRSAHERRPAIAEALDRVRGPEFRDSLDRALLGMGEG
jgi:CHAD domain-containing protein